MSLFNGLYTYEIVLLVCGALLFVVLLFLLIYQVTHAKSFAGLLLFFGIAIAMIGYPSIQEIQFSASAVTITKYTEALQANPSDAKAREVLQQTVSKFADRAAAGKVDVQALTTLATAQYALDDDSAATANLQKVLQVSPTEPAALELKRKIDAVQNLNSLTANVKADPSNQAAAAALAKSLQSAVATPVANPTALFKIAQAQAALGQKKEAQVNLRTALTIKPELAANP
jgi:tetratricopeptide (TPR) repeat protein